MKQNAHGNVMKQEMFLCRYAERIVKSKCFRGIKYNKTKYEYNDREYYEYNNREYMNTMVQNMILNALSTELFRGNAWKISCR